MAQDKEEKKTEDETYKAEAAHRLELAKADEKRIREEIEALKKEIEKAKEAREGKVIDIQWAEEELADCRLPPAGRDCRTKKGTSGKNHQFRQPRRTARLNRFQPETKGLCR